MKTIIAADPGASGGIAWWHELDVLNPVNARPMPATRGDLILLLKAIIKESSHLESKPVAYIEKISGFIPDGGASQMFEFGRSVERVGCILETLGCRIIEVTPQAWQKALEVGQSNRIQVPRCASLRISKTASAEEKRAAKKAHAIIKREFEDKNADAIKRTKQFNEQAKREWKTKLKSTAQRLFPGIDATLKTSDCLLILEYAMRTEGGGQMLQPGTGKAKQEYVEADTEPLPFT